MCRLLGYVADRETNFSKLLGSDYAEFVALSKVHCDGWGIATNDAKSDHLTREVSPAMASQTFSKANEKLVSAGALLHFRWATPGLPITLENTHPFSHNGISFIHNGSISPVTSLDEWISEKYFKEINGNGDTERFFYYLLTEIDRYGFVKGIKTGIERIRNEIEYSSLNCMVLSKDMYVIVAEHDPDRIPAIFDADYYELRYKKTDHEVIVGSSGWNQTGWIPISNHSMLVINRTSLSTEVITFA